TPTSGGTYFKVWAPDADQVAVTGVFGRRSLRKLTGGAFGGRVRAATVGQAYTYEIQSAGQTVERIDPRAAQVTNSAGTALIHDPNAYAWQSAAYQAPAWPDLVVYELHLGTFNDDAGGKPGTWASAAEKLDDLADLGVTAVEVMPPAEFAGDYSWG